MKCFLFVVAAMLLACAAYAEEATPLVELDDSNWDETVFGEKPYFVLFYAPWCGHCKSVKPIFRNASYFNHNLIEEKYRGESATFAMLDATANTNTAKRYGVKSFPTFIYTIRGQGYAYDAGRGINDFSMWGRYLHLALKNGFADDLSLPSTFNSLHDEKLKFDRANFFFVLPDTKENTPQEVKDRATRVIDEIASFGRARYSLLYAGDTERVIVDNGAEAAASEKVVNIGVSQQQVLAAYKSLDAAAKTEDGAAIVLATDAHYEPIHCPVTSWLNENQTLNVDLKQWVKANAFRAVEEINADTFGILARRGTLMILATYGPTPTDDSILPAVREIVKKHNKEGKQIPFGYLDGITFQPWLEQFGIDSETELPIVFGLQSKTEQVYLLDDFKTKMTPLLAAKHWKVNGPQQKIIEKLVAQVEQGSLTGVRYTTIGKVVGTVLGVAPFLQPLHTLIGGDAEFAAVLFGFFVLAFVLILSMGSEPERRVPSTPASPNTSSADLKKNN